MDIVTLNIHQGHLFIKGYYSTKFDVSQVNGPHDI